MADQPDPQIPPPPWLLHAREILDPDEPGIAPGRAKRRRQMLGILHASEADELPSPRILETDARLRVEFLGFRGAPALTLAHDRLLTQTTLMPLSSLRLRASSLIDVVRMALHGRINDHQPRRKP